MQNLDDTLFNNYLNYSLTSDICKSTPTFLILDILEEKEDPELDPSKSWVRKHDVRLEMLPFILRHGFPRVILS